MRIHEVIRRKGDGVVTVRPDHDVAHLLAVLAEHEIGAVVVSEDDGATVAGIVSERDIVRRLHTEGVDVLGRPVSAIMTSAVHTCVPQDELDTLARTMTEQRVRHLPVVVEGRLQGIVSIGDVVKRRLEELQAEKDQLVDYLQR